MVSLLLLLGCNLSYIVDSFAILHELASASARKLLRLASSRSVRALLKPNGDTLNAGSISTKVISGFNKILSLPAGINLVLSQDTGGNARNPQTEMLRKHMTTLRKYNG